MIVTGALDIWEGIPISSAVTFSRYVDAFKEEAFVNMLPSLVM